MITITIDNANKRLIAMPVTFGILYVIWLQQYNLQPSKIFVKITAKHVIIITAKINTVETAMNVTVDTVVNILFM